MTPFDLLVHNTSEVLTLDAPVDQGLSPITNCAVGVSSGKIAYLGPESEVPRESVTRDTQRIDARGGFVGPGFVDPHTHLVFAGERSHEFELRCLGKSYLDIAKAGGGILATVRATRAASQDELVELARPRLQRLLEQGVTTAEVKSGYGLDLPNELKMLRAVRTLGGEQPMELVPTLLCAHAVPEEHLGTPDRYVDECVGEILPAVARERLARFCDAFVEAVAFTAEQARRILVKGVELGLVPKLHADQLTRSGGVDLAAELCAASADHLEQVSAEGIEKLRQAEVSAVLMPTSTLFLRQSQYAPGRRLWDAGLNVALATNVNPGSAMSENVSLTLGLACLMNGLTPAEAYWGLTRGAALALRLPAHGRIAVGGPADLVVFKCASYRHLPYHLGVNHAQVVVKAGKVVASHAPAPALCR